MFRHQVIDVSDSVYLCWDAFKAYRLHVYFSLNIFPFGSSKVAISPRLRDNANENRSGLAAFNGIIREAAESFCYEVSGRCY